MTAPNPVAPSPPANPALRARLAVVQAQLTACCAAERETRETQRALALRRWRLLGEENQIIEQLKGQDDERQT